MKVTCGVCGTENDSGAEFCETCGVELAPPKASDPADAHDEEVATEDPGGSPQADVDGSSDVAPVLHESVAAPRAAPVSPAATGRPGTSASAVTLTPVRQGGDPKSLSLPEGRFVVGRFDPSTGPVEVDLTGYEGADTISRRHAVVRFEDGRWYVEDQGSLNGVFLRRAGEDDFAPRIEGEQVVRDGDEVAFGNVIFKVGLSDA